MIVTVHWQSTYRYSTPVRQVHNELRVMPAARHGQRRLTSSLTVEPGTEPLELLDAFGNEYHYVGLLGTLTEFTTRMEATVQTGQGTYAEPISELTRHLMLRSTPRCPADERIVALARETGGTEPLEVAARLLALLGSRFQYELGHTSVDDGALALVERGRGVCQDFAHLMLAVLRHRGIPARYVSGYVAPWSGTERTDAGHAWVQVYAYDAWHGFDPSRQLLQDERYVICNVGRDYDDVPPLRGTFWGTARQSWESSIEITTHEQ